MRYPSVSRIEKLLELPREKAKEVRGIIDGSVDPEKYPSVEEWMRRCYNRPRDLELRMEALNEILEGFGVEAIQPEGAYVDNYWFSTVAIYVNNGDTYKPTVLYDSEREEFEITSWGDWVEKRGL